MIEWLKDNLWIWTVVGGICAVVTLIFKFIPKREGKNRQIIGNVTNSKVNQAGRDINNDRQEK